MQENPFTPSFGEIPPYMAGRSKIVNDLTKALKGRMRNPNLTTLLTGARGTGKTALLSLIAEKAEENGWISVNVTALPGMLEDIYERTAEAIEQFVEPEGAHITGIGLGKLVSLKWERKEKSPGNWRTQMNHLFKVLESQEIGLLITVDEVQPDLDEMILLSSTYQHFVREEKKVALLMAGLPHNISMLLQDKSVSFLRRAQRHHLGSVPDFEIEDALKKTVVQAGRTISGDVLKNAVRVIGGFPYMMQLVGYRMWEQNPQKKAISSEDVHEGVELAKAEMENSVLEATYRTLSKGDLRFLQAMLKDDGDSSMVDIAQRMDESYAYAAQYKKRLLGQGVIGERSRGFVGFDIPLFKEYLQEQD